MTSFNILRRNVVCLALLATLSIIISLSNAQETLIFSEDFNSFSLRRWKHEITMAGGGNNEFELYTNNRSISYVRDSILYIKPGLTSDWIGGVDNLHNADFTLDLWGMAYNDICTGNADSGCVKTGGGADSPYMINPITSARIRSAESFSFRYGRVEVRAKLPRGDWLWPAIWMLPTDNSYGAWPASGEIDIMESRGNAASYSAGGVDTFGSTLHWGPYWGQDPFELTHAEYKLKDGSDFSDNFHTFGLLWNSTHIITYLDDPSNVVLNVAIADGFWKRGGFDKTTLDNPWKAGSIDAPFDQEFYLILNVAVGGTCGYFPDGVGSKPWTDSNPTDAAASFWSNAGKWYSTWNGEDAAMQVDWIRVWQLDQ